MAGVERLMAVVKALQDRAAKSIKDNNCSVAVGFQTNYALYVHEDMQAHHNVGQAKYLEQPARQLGKPGGELGEIVKTAIKQGKTVAQALLLAGLRLQREAQQLVPVDTGALKNSAFTTLIPGPPP